MNSVLFHSSLLHIVTAGIERHVILHSPTKSSPCAKDLTFTPQSVRALPAGSTEDHSRFFRAMSLGLYTNDLDEDAEAIALFDEYVLCIVTERKRVLICQRPIGSLELKVKGLIYSRAEVAMSLRMKMRRYPTRMYSGTDSNCIVETKHISPRLQGRDLKNDHWSNMISQ